MSGVYSAIAPSILPRLPSVVAVRTDLALVPFTFQQQPLFRDCTNKPSLSRFAVQVIGYCGRIWSHFDDMAIGGFVIQAILILIAPALYAASIYMILGRLICALHAEQVSVIPVKWMTKVFVVGDVLSFLLQAGGGGIQAAGTLELFNIGEKIIIVGLFIQIFMFGFFLVTTVVFHIRFRRSSGSERQQTLVRWKRHLTVLYVVSAIIMVRSIFRVVEYLQGNRGYLISHEIFLYVFDAVLMALVMAIFFVFYVDDLEASKAGKHDSAMEMLSSRDSGDPGMVPRPHDV